MKALITVWSVRIVTVFMVGMMAIAILLNHSIASAIALHFVSGFIAFCIFTKPTFKKWNLMATGVLTVFSMLGIFGLIGMMLTCDGELPAKRDMIPGLSGT